MLLTLVTLVRSTRAGDPRLVVVDHQCAQHLAAKQGAQLTRPPVEAHPPGEGALVRSS